MCSGICDLLHCVLSCLTSAWPLGVAHFHSWAPTGSSVHTAIAILPSCVSASGHALPPVHCIKLAKHWLYW